MRFLGTLGHVGFLLLGRDSNPARGDAAIYLRDIAVYADEKIATRFPSGFVEWFHREACCITELYVSLLWRKVLTPDTAKVNLVFVEQEGFVPSVRQLIKVADAKWLIRFSEYAEKDAVGKKRMILDGLQSALVWIAEERGWNVGAFDACYAEAIRRNLTFEGWSKKSWASPDRKYRARVGFCFGLRAVDFFVGVFDKRGREAGRKPLGSVVPEMGIAHPILTGTGKWNAANMFRLQIADVHFRLPKTWEADLSDLVA
jgi:hypothetical protein